MCAWFEYRFHLLAFYRCKFNLGAESFAGKVFINASIARSHIPRCVYSAKRSLSRRRTSDTCKPLTNTHAHTRPHTLAARTQDWILIYFLIKNFTNNFRLWMDLLRFDVLNCWWFTVQFAAFSDRCAFFAFISHSRFRFVLSFVSLAVLLIGLALYRRNTLQWSSIESHTPRHPLHRPRWRRERER